MPMTQDQKSSLISRLQLRWLLMLRSILDLWVKPRLQADADGNIGVSGDQPVCYVLDSYALSSVLILDQCCEQQGLARPLVSVPGVGQCPLRSYAALKRRKGLIFRRPDTRSHSDMLKLMIDSGWADQDLDIQLVPVTVLIG